MSNVANWSYTAPCTIWRNLGFAENGDSLGWSAPEIIMCDYRGGLAAEYSALGTSITAKNTFWTEFSEAKRGDYLLIGESAEPDPIEAGADEVMTKFRDADTFDRLADDWVIITGV